MTYLQPLISTGLTRNKTSSTLNVTQPKVVIGPPLSGEEAPQGEPQPLVSNQSRLCIEMCLKLSLLFGRMYFCLLEFSRCKNMFDVTAGSTPLDIGAERHDAITSSRVGVDA